MRLTESAIRRIIKEEATRVIKESEADVGNKMDPVGLVEFYMIHIEDLFKGNRDHDDAMDEAEQMIEDLCFNMNETMHDWLMEYLKDNHADRAEYEMDAEYDRRMHAGEDNDR